MVMASVFVLARHFCWFAPLEISSLTGFGCQKKTLFSQTNGTSQDVLLGQRDLSQGNQQGLGKNNITSSDSEIGLPTSTDNENVQGITSGLPSTTTSAIFTTTTPTTTADVAQCDNDYACLELARRDKDESLCPNIKNPNTKSQCFSQVAIAKKDKAICKKAEDYFQDSCLFSFALATQDTSVCSLIEIAAIKDMCLAELTQRQ